MLIFSELYNKFIFDKLFSLIELFKEIGDSFCNKLLEIYESSITEIFSSFEFLELLNEILSIKNSESHISFIFSGRSKLFSRQF